MMLNRNDAVRVEAGYLNGPAILIFRCVSSECSNECRSEDRPRCLRLHSGKCRNCAQKKLPFHGSYKSMLDSVTRTNTKRGRSVPVDLTYEQFLTFTKIQTCHYCGTTLQWNAHTSMGRYKTNLDRKDSNKGYSIDNVVACCKYCNYAKNSYFSYEEFKQIVKYLKKSRKTDQIWDDRNIKE